MFYFVQGLFLYFRYITRAILIINHFFIKVTLIVDFFSSSIMAIIHILR